MNSKALFYASRLLSFRFNYFYKGHIYYFSQCFYWNAMKFFHLQIKILQFIQLFIGFNFIPFLNSFQATSFLVSSLE